MMNNENIQGPAAAGDVDRGALLDRLDNIGDALSRASERDDFESRWARTLLIEALHTNVSALRRLNHAPGDATP